MRHVERKAGELIKRHNITKPPVSVETIAKRMQAKLSFEPFEGQDDISGILYRDGENTVIGINSAHPDTRQRFSIAHELGHLLLHKKNLFVDKVINRDSKSSLAIDKAEIEANAFAAELLMPRNFIMEEIQRKLAKRNFTLSKEKLIETLARKFKVSTQAMEYRLNNLGILISQ